ncbi:MAG: RES domain-containing protein [Anaerolineales bacterium]|nr:RES domain-containing protein [Anaerolineales bacterium]
MTLQSWRIVKRQYSDDAFNGEGARVYGGRWNSPGAPMVYTAENASLAVLEILVHLELTSILSNYILFRVEFGEGAVEFIEAATLPEDWQSYPGPNSLRSIGDRWLEERRSVVLSVPSVILPIERLFLLNPLHPDFDEIRIGEPQPFQFDSRLIKP